MDDICLKNFTESLSLLDQIESEPYSFDMWKSVLVQDITLATKVPKRLLLTDCLLDIFSDLGVRRYNKRDLNRLIPSKLEERQCACKSDKQQMQISRYATYLSSVGERFIGFDKMGWVLSQICFRAPADYIFAIRSNACLPQNLVRNVSVAVIERDIGIRSIRKRWYEYDMLSDTPHKFFVIESRKATTIESCFFNFDDFYEYVDGRIGNMDLRNYDFLGVDLTKYDWSSFSQAIISADVLKRYNRCDTTLYDLVDRTCSHDLAFVSDANSIARCVDIFRSSDTEEYKPVFYISDIHLEWHLRSLYQSAVDNNEVIYDIQHIVDMLMNSVPRDISPNACYFLFAGDIADNIELAEIFYRLFRNRCWSSNVIAIMGNHEVWGLSDKYDNVDDIVNQYRTMLSRYDILLLENDLVIFDYFECSLRHVSEFEILSMSMDDLRRICLSSSFVCFGGIGWSGAKIGFADYLCMGFGENDIMMDSVMTNRWLSVYNKIQQVADECTIIVCTHTPVSYWTNMLPVDGWIYVNGHTHVNNYVDDDDYDYRVYADNQVGYHMNDMAFKYFRISRLFDPFVYYSDGIYEINRFDYLTFLYGTGCRSVFNRTNGTIFMLKRLGFYMFLWRETNRPNLFLLNGGRKLKLKNWDISYYFDNMCSHAFAIKQLFSHYRDILLRISAVIKSIGGSGRIHGCIVDIDYFNHIYVDPMGDYIMPYFATDIVNKYEYETVQHLLLAHCPDLYKNYVCLLESGSASDIGLMHSEFAALANYISVTDLCSKPSTAMYVSSTSMYKPSRIALQAQRLFENNIIRLWDDSLLYSDNNVLSQCPLYLSSGGTNN